MGKVEIVHKASKRLGTGVIGTHIVKKGGGGKSATESNSRNKSHPVIQLGQGPQLGRFKKRENGSAEKGRGERERQRRERERERESDRDSRTKQ